MAKMQDLPADIILIILEILFTDIEVKTYPFTNAKLSIHRPSPAIINVCRKFYDIGQEKLQQATVLKLTDLAIDGLPYPNGQEPIDAKVSDKCPKGARALHVRGFLCQDVEKISEMCANLKGLQILKWKAKDMPMDIYQSPLPARNTAKDLWDMFQPENISSSLFNKYMKGLKNVSRVKLSFRVDRHVVCPGGSSEMPDDTHSLMIGLLQEFGPQVIQTHRIHGYFTIRFGTAVGRTSISLEDDKVKLDLAPQGSGCQCVQRYPTYEWRNFGEEVDSD